MDPAWADSTGTPPEELSGRLETTIWVTLDGVVGMDLTGQREFDAPRERIWERVFDPAVMEACIPGAESVTKTADAKYKGEVVRGLASIRISMDLTVEIVEDKTPEMVRCAVEGTDSITNSSVEGGAEVRIASTDDGTSLLEYAVDLEFTGRIVSLGTRLVKRQLDADLKRFFENLEEHLE